MEGDWLQQLPLEAKASFAKKSYLYVFLSPLLSEDLHYLPILTVQQYKLDMTNNIRRISIQGLNDKYDSYMPSRMYHKAIIQTQK